MSTFTSALDAEGAVLLPSFSEIISQDETGIVINEGDSYFGRGTGTDEAPWRRPQRPHRQTTQRFLPLSLDSEDRRDESIVVSILDVECAIKDGINLQLHESRREIQQLQADGERLRTRVASRCVLFTSMTYLPFTNRNKRTLNCRG
jgi:hypothetical protein